MHMDINELALLKAIRENSTADDPRLIYADWLQDAATTEPERARAEMIRAQVKLLRGLIYWSNRHEEKKTPPPNPTDASLRGGQVRAGGTVTTSLDSITMPFNLGVPQYDPGRKEAHEELQALEEQERVLIGRFGNAWRAAPCPACNPKGTPVNIGESKDFKIKRCYVCDGSGDLFVKPTLASKPPEHRLMLRRPSPGTPFPKSVIPDRVNMPEDMQILLQYRNLTLCRGFYDMVECTFNEVGIRKTRNGLGGPEYETQEFVPTPWLMAVLDAPADRFIFTRIRVTDRSPSRAMWSLSRSATAYGWLKTIDDDPLADGLVENLTPAGAGMILNGLGSAQVPKEIWDHIPIPKEFQKEENHKPNPVWKWFPNIHSARDALDRAVYRWAQAVHTATNTAIEESEEPK